jgi:hypothetical protein
MEINEEIEYVKHLAECELCRKRVEDYSVINSVIFFDVEAPDVKTNVYRKIDRSKNFITFLVLSVALSMVLFGSHMIIQSNNVETNLILQALNNGNITEDGVTSNEARVPEYMETAYSYGNW